MRGIDGDYLLIDEFQDIAGGDLPVLEEALSHSPHRRVFLTGTPKSIDNHLEDAFNRSTANEWRVPCRCGQQVFLDEKCLGLPTCLGDHVVTREEVEQCCQQRAMATCLEDVPLVYRKLLVAGIDWGGVAPCRGPSW